MPAPRLLLRNRGQAFLVTSYQQVIADSTGFRRKSKAFSAKSGPAEPLPGRYLRQSDRHDHEV